MKSLNNRDTSRDVAVKWEDNPKVENCSCHISPPCFACTEIMPYVDEALAISELDSTDGFEVYVPYHQLVEVYGERDKLAEQLEALNRVLAD